MVNDELLSIYLEKYISSKFDDGIAYILCIDDHSFMKFSSAMFYFNYYKNKNIVYGFTNRWTNRIDREIDLYELKLPIFNYVARCYYRMKYLCENAFGIAAWNYHNHVLNCVSWRQTSLMFLLGGKEYHNLPEIFNMRRQLTEKYDKVIQELRVTAMRILEFAEMSDRYLTFQISSI